MQGQAAHFKSQDIPYASKRYFDETLRLYGVLEIRLTGREYLAGPGLGSFSLAEIKAAPWVNGYTWLGLENLDEFPNVKAWLERFNARPGVKSGLAIPA